jgi:hypothetical protein
MPALGVTTRPTHIDWEYAYERFGPELRVFEALLASFESARGLQLTPSAIELLLVPLVDELDAERQVDHAVLIKSLEELFDELEASPDPRDEGQVRSAVSVVRAWHLRWCKSPPFCAKP